MYSSASNQVWSKRSRDSGVLSENCLQCVDQSKLVLDVDAVKLFSGPLPYTIASRDEGGTATEGRDRKQRQQQPLPSLPHSATASLIQVFPAHTKTGS